MKKTVKDIDIKGKKVIMRVDFNVPLDKETNSKIMDTTRVDAAMPTIEYILSQGASLILMSHLGRPKGEANPKYSLKPVYDYLKTKLPNNKVIFANDCIGEEVKKTAGSLNAGDVLLLENLRYHAEEEKNDANFSKQLADLADVYVNDAFGSSHRKHASTYGIKKYLKSYYGLLIDEEINKLQELINNDKHPFTVIMGGAKVEDKLELISELLKKCDNLIVGGGIANTFMYAKNFNIGKSLVSLNNTVEIKELINKYNDKIITPLDFYVENGENKKYRKLDEINNEDIIYDVGPLSLERYKGIIDNSKIIFINGTMGLYENANYKYGTEELLKELANSNGKVFVGGGDAVSATNKLGYKDAFYYKSTGGGATLEYIISKHLAALED